MSKYQVREDYYRDGVYYPAGSIVDFDESKKKKIGIGKLEREIQLEKPPSSAVKVSDDAPTGPLQTNDNPNPMPEKPLYTMSVAEQRSPQMAADGGDIPNRRESPQERTDINAQPDSGEHGEHRKRKRPSDTTPV